MAEVKGVYRGNGAYTYADLSNKAWGLRAASISEYRSGSGSTILEVPDIENLTKNSWNLSGISDSQVQSYFSGDPISVLNDYQSEALKNYWANQNPDKQQFLISEGGNVWDEFANKEQSALLEQDTNYGALPSTETPVTGNANERAAGAGSNLGVTGKGTLKYPIDMDLNIQDHMVITVAEYVPAGRLPSIFGSTDQGQFVRTFNNKLLETIIIPMPNAIADQNSVSWGPSEMGAVKGTLANPLVTRILGRGEGEPTTGENINTLFDNPVTRFVGDYGKALGDLASSQYIRRRLLLNATASAAGRFGVQIDVGAVLSRTAGVIDNPNIELLFNGPGLRTFDFTVRLTPRSTDESKMVRQIIRVLKQRMAVKKNVRRFTASGNLLLGTPNVFRLEYRKGSRNRSEIKGLNKFKTCAMTNFRVDYSGGSGRWAAYGPDSQPVTTIITMSFTEIVPIYENDYSEFPAGDDVGF